VLEEVTIYDVKLSQQLNFIKSSWAKSCVIWLKVHIVICCINELTTDLYVVITLFLCCQYSWYDVVTGAVHFQTLLRTGWHLSTKIQIFSALISLSDSDQRAYILLHLSDIVLVLL